MRITWAISVKAGRKRDIPGFTRLYSRHVQGYPVISHLVPSYPLERYPRTSQDIPRQDSCLGISHFRFSVLGYPGLSRDKHQVWPRLSRDILGYPLVSFFQMALQCPQTVAACGAVVMWRTSACSYITINARVQPSSKCSGMHN